MKRLILSGCALVLAAGSVFATAGPAAATVATQSYTVYGRYDTLRACTNVGQVVGGSYWQCDGPHDDGKYWLYTDDGYTD